MPRNIRNTRRNFARPSNTITVAASPATPFFANGDYATSIDVTRVTNPVGPSGLGVYRATSSPSGLTGTTTSTATTSTVTIGIPTSTATGSYTISVSDDNYNGTGKPIAAANAVSINPASLFTSTVLVIGGGGGGGGAANQGGGFNSYAGGGGAGAYREFSSYTLGTGTNFNVTIGAGGAQSAIGSSSIFSTITAGGGGYAEFVGNSTAYNGVAGVAGASGGGGGGNSGVSTSTTGGVYVTPTSPVILTGKELYTSTGSNGGNRSGTTQCGAGGGASGAGGNNSTAPIGGTGRASLITGSSVTRAGGGGAAGNNANGSAGTANTGGGGGGSFDNQGAYRDGGAGGSGVVILRYPNTFTITIGAGLTGSTATTGSDKVTTITAGTGNVSWA